ncbi:hypothetical protein DICPUDRAFT_158712 [Dictyostelium purpureum]|uniref:GATA-type domain-containing protein n=1 Tax=Dictyostelium purpureum TaxID=5786 RepID=F1A2A0_DICPU|nr:uncharacterized protein DICPUDRAFT_158712 [Dictyostelium purpureum]EGC29682.1 hypothetical protein DICPUDRAFT_158712 [Dictyostelium purpureum]|eukprot:XP_003293787.1 hypothetical protein DICPUDRAFT_158712 [Dictyostelium purpureum]
MFKNKKIIKKVKISRARIEEKPVNKVCSQCHTTKSKYWRKGSKRDDGRVLP